MQGRINVPRGLWHIIGAGPLDPPPNGILNPEFSKIKKSCVEKFPVYLQKEKELYINNLIELKFNPVYTINIIIYRGKIAKHDSVHINFCRLPRNSAIF
jgi:hypothetical protein